MGKKLSKLLVIIGPTASGKTALSVLLAQKFNGELINADSRQIYKTMDIGTAKITEEEREGVPHHLFDIIEPDQSYNLADYQRGCFAVIKDIVSRGKLPILIGGTGLYISAVIENYTLGDKPEKGPQLFDYLLIEPLLEREELYKRINQRQLEMMDKGLEDEVRGLSKKYGWGIPSMTGIGYRQFKDYFAGAINKEELIRHLQRDNRHLAKRQLTWFRRYANEICRVKDYKEAEKIIKYWISL